MHLAPLFITMPLLFVSILFTLWTLNNRNRFKGFKQKRMW
jgi:membrane-bound acyltransferase YfiQ involved in biofilm formation